MASLRARNSASAAPAPTTTSGYPGHGHFVGRYGRNTNFGNLLGLCAVSLPCGFTVEGLPIGLMIYAKPFREEMALRVAQAYEQATDWHRRRPDLTWIG